jgi:MFS family permease
VLAVTFVAFEALAVATILPLVGRHLGDVRLYGWVFSAFLLASLIGIVVAGTLADRVPLGQPMLAGLALFALGLVIGGTAPTMAVLVAGRTLTHYFVKTSWHRRSPGDLADAKLRAVPRPAQAAVVETSTIGLRAQSKQ